MEKTISLRGIASDVSTLYINGRTYYSFTLNCAEMGIYKVYVRQEDAEWDIEDEKNYSVSGMEIAGDVVIATSVDRWGRVCDTCGKWMSEGYYLAGEYACSSECAIVLYNGDANAFYADLELLDNPATADDAEVYWTEWD